ncbi:hypothetical protein CCACVL1_23520 [Corchorus capsularis]|uniref:Uncharacterized protein n=1 Tax=Corchorus capsularis TaxID=210143 RepID=A0A1R3GTN8_COCAP|nr:hypothetical protein CCACVL1_23520 [Corchorus capsularis]
MKPDAFEAEGNKWQLDGNQLSKSIACKSIDVFP